ncbi:hypothetical protein [Bradyrhizobium sp. LHD-71]|uniref:hypothetical protein n=1 Tax=Bradyrhizobium sp. LHD-71 TaxID=3072141 RepID=UPI0028104B05|nr:hypothetical protein [Bradyrhizobium sp. LHD-71]MDQ8728075.1 hypothetical protein [Bradyrhizobium sp. LHD-71]
MHMRIPFLVAIAVLGSVAPSVAQERPAASPEILIGGGAPVSIASETCVEVEIGSSRAFNCLNQKLRRQVDRVNPSMNIPPVDARSQDIRVGVVNMPAVQQQYGRNFGVSVIPYRPSLPTYSSPVGRR